MHQVTIGLEIHIELKTKSKMFCSCKNDPDEKRPNFNICPICTGHPGTLPVANEDAIRKVIKTGLALNCQIPEYSKFDRKNYFYPDLPKGYQISQYDMPLCKDGLMEIGGKKIRIRRVHLEEDTGRLLHPEGTKYSLVDFNRAGIPLMELVTEPDLESAQEAKKFSQELQLILRYLNVSNADMEKGQMRVEANISLREKFSDVLGTKVEIKNLNSFRAAEKAIEYEIKRQKESLESDEKIKQETRGWNEAKGITVSQREKEEAHDYRYFPEPDLPILHLGVPDYLNKIKAEIPELPQQKRERFQREYQLSEKEVEIFVSNKDLGEYFEKEVSELSPNLEPEELAKRIRIISNYLITDLQGLLAGKPFIESEIKITPENFAEFSELVITGTISTPIAKIVLKEMFETGRDPSQIIEEKGLVQITDSSEIENIVKEVILKNQKAVEDYNAGKGNALQFLIGKVMTESKGKANPEVAKNIIQKTLTVIKKAV